MIEESWDWRALLVLSVIITIPLLFLGVVIWSFTPSGLAQDKLIKKVDQCYNQTATDYCNSINMTFDSIYRTNPIYFFCYPIVDEHFAYDYHLRKQFKFTTEEQGYCTSLYKNADLKNDNESVIHLQYHRDFVETKCPKNLNATNCYEINSSKLSQAYIAFWEGNNFTIASTNTILINYTKTHMPELS